MTEKIKLSSIRVDLEREKKGDWVPYPFWDGVRFQVSALNLPVYETARDLLFRRLRKKHPKGLIPREVLSPALGELYAKYILHGWDGFDEDYSPELAHKRLTDPEYRELVSAVEFCATKLTEVDPESVGDDVGNSSPPSENV